MLTYKIGGQDILHVARIEERVVDTIEGGVYLRVFDRLGHILDANHLAGLTRHEVGDGARAGIEVVHALVARQLGEVARHLIKFVGLTAVGLIERFRAYLETQPLHLLDDVILALEDQDFLVGDGIVTLLVNDIHERGDLREALGDVAQQRLTALHVFMIEREHDHQVACRGGADH